MMMIALIVSLLAADPVQGARARDTVAIAADAPADALRPKVDQAATLIATGHDVEALALLDAVIGDEERQHARETRRIYCARSLTETLLYLSMGAKDRGAVALDATWSDALYLKGFVLVDLRRPAEAEAMLRQAIEHAPMNARYLGELGELYKARKDWAHASQYFDSAATAAAFSPDDRKSFEQRRAWRGQAFVLTELSKLDEAEALYRKCLVLDAGDAGARHELDYIAGLRRQAAKTTS